MDKIYLGVQKYKKILYYNVFKETFCYGIVFSRTYKKAFSTHYEENAGMVWTCSRRCQKQQGSVSS